MYFALKHLESVVAYAKLLLIIVVQLTIQYSPHSPEKVFQL